MVGISKHRQRIVGLVEILEAALAPGPAQRAQLRVERLVVEHQDALEEGRATRHLAPTLHIHQRRMLVVAQRHLLRAQLP